MTSPATAQSRQRESVRESERVARATWQPVRSASRDSASQNSDPAANSRSRSSSESASRVRVAQHESEATLPPPRSVVEGSDEIVEYGSREYRDAMSLDGQVIYDPMPGQISGGTHFSGGTQFPGDGCGCEEIGCDGTCDGLVGCDGYCGDASGCGGGCGPEAWRPCLTLCLPQDGWASFEYLAWWQDGMRLPPLVTSNLGTGIAGTDAGVLGRASTVTRFGGDRVLEEAFEGGRLRFGVWLDRRHKLGVGAEYFSTGTLESHFQATSSGNPILGRPFFNTETGQEDSSLVAFPGLISGTVGVRADSELDGWGVHFRHLRERIEGHGGWLFCGAGDKYCARAEMLLGYRGLQLDERVLVTENSVSSDEERFDMFDRFDTRNQFNGVDVGWAYERTRGYWTFDSAIRLALGNTRQTVTVDGRTTITDPSDPPAQTYTGGLLAQPSNIGTFRQDEFTVVPEINANIGFHLTDNLQLTFGYTFIYWSNVVRPGDHISRDLNPNQLPPAADPLTGANRPGFRWDTVDYWVQGMNVGGEYRW